MRTHLSDQIVLAVKDRLRAVRYTIRRGVNHATADAARPEAAAPHPVALAADTVFSQVEAAAAALLPSYESATVAFAFPQAATAYFGAEARDAHALTPEIYYALKALLRRFGSDVFLVSELAVHEACERVAARQIEDAAAATDGSRIEVDRWAACVRLCAALAAAIAAARPIRELTPSLESRNAPKNLLLAPNEYCAFVIGLAIALSSKSDVADVDPSLLLDSADFAVDARFAELSAALKGRQPEAALAAEFEGMLRFLP